MAKWAVWFKDHIHTDRFGQLAIFVSRAAARNWVHKYGLSGCVVRKLYERD